jgi:hypothetical protein
MVSSKLLKRVYMHIFLPLLLTISLSAVLCQCQTMNIIAQKMPIKRTDANVSIDVARTQSTSQFNTGVSYTENDDVSYLTSKGQLLQAALTFQNVPLMGWGADNPEPVPGIYNWSSLDARVQLMRDTHATKIITLCCAPTWMFDSAWVGRTDWNRLETAPTPEHFADFANLTQQVALRYKDVQYFQVWNELKGFYNAALNRWDYEGYTTMYNMVYDAIKAVRPDAKIGGPYIVMDTWADPDAGGWPPHDPTLLRQPWGTIDQRSLDTLSYWLAHKHGADFLLVDGGTGTREGKWVTDDFTAANVFPAIINWIRKQPHGGATLPVGFAEWYPNVSQNATDINYRNAVFAHDLIVLLKSGYWYALLWGIQGDSLETADSPVALLTNKGQPTDEYYTFKAIKDYFGPGTQLCQTTSSSPNITVLATKVKTILVNHLNTSQSINVNGVQVVLNPYQVKIINTPT